MTFRDMINEAKSNAKIHKVIVKGLERYIVQGSENKKPFVIANDGIKRIGKDFFKEIPGDLYFKTEKEAAKYINESMFSKDKDEDWDFAESVIVLALKKIGMKPKGKIKDKTSSMNGVSMNMWQFVAEEFTYEQKIELTNFLKKYKFKQNSAAPEDDIEGIFVADGTEFHFSALNYFDKKGDGKAYIRIYKNK